VVSLSSHPMRLPIPAVLMIVTSVALWSGCTTYIPPSGRADLVALGSPSLQEGFAARPAAGFPASIAVVRIQAPRYRSYYTEQEGGVYGEGRYSVITTKEVEEEADLQRITSLPQVGGLITISTLLLPQTLQSDREIREAAARLKADMVLLYTFDTSFHENDASVALNVVTLGLSPTRRIFVRVPAQALLMDTRTGFIYAALEANEKRQVTTNAWESRESADRARRDAEKAAFKALVSDFERNWPEIVERAKRGA
ncbi:MAG: hypothetical protein KIT22_20715, partial [Verrucomicrobiae bacterium]|nr:hypothetical protein [Verrucomicrobiae bacterium]